MIKLGWEHIILLFFIILICVSLHSNSNGFLRSPIFVFSVSNIIISVIFFKRDRESAEGFDGIMAFFGFVYENNEEQEILEGFMDEMRSDVDDDDEDEDEDEDEDDDDDDSDAYFYDSDGYISDDEKEELYDEKLESRIEEFIAKVINRWKEESFMENYSQ
ncbi:hypothetical protein CDL12_00142 [Handroanthus impetiginosus]|uniref:Uncharacterized protein n=1 Tax=Handroanthus impetiginosus TaxID=429701 RepID=A0A2G9IBG0_9LAMI|nr:hypothetical protein CDL12_00142 [Handroanthus impetiginosus]